MKVASRNTFEIDQIFNALVNDDLNLLKKYLTPENMNTLIDDNFAEYDINNKFTAAYAAVNFARWNCLVYILGMGADPNIISERDSSCLSSAIMHENLDYARILLDAGAIVDSADEKGLTSLHEAIRYSGYDAAYLLIDRGAKLSNVRLDSQRRISHLVDNPPREIPEWINIFINARNKCRKTSLLMIGIHKNKLTTVTSKQDVNVLRLISKHIWSTRITDEWSAAPLKRGKIVRIKKKKEVARKAARRGRGAIGGHIHPN